MAIPARACRELSAAAQSPSRFDAQTHEDEIASFVDAVRVHRADRDRLLDLLLEQHPLYMGRSANETTRIRGYVLAAFEDTGLPDAALPYVLEELESGRSAYLVAAAAKAVRGGRPDARISSYLLRAIENIRLNDDTVSFECSRPRWPIRHPTTALTEIFRTFGWLGPAAWPTLNRLTAMADPSSGEFSTAVRREIDRAIAVIGAPDPQADRDCCSELWTLRSAIRHVSPSKGSASRGKGIVLEDQDGRTGSLDEWLRGKPAIVTFFYTRCDNPNKCSLTVTRLARLQEAIRARGLAGRIRTMAITYDPQYDRADVIRAYALNRGVSFSDHDRVVRTIAGFDQLRRRFELGVNFGPATVNRHRIELVVLDANRRISATFARLQWNVDAVLDEAVRLLPPAAERGQSHVAYLGPVASAILALTPKCPMCWASYMSALGVAGLDWIPYDSRVRLALVSMIVINLAAVGLRARSRAWWSVWAMLSSVAGTVGMLVAGMAFDIRSGLTYGAVLIALGSVLSSLPARTAHDATA